MDKNELFNGQKEIKETKEIKEGQYRLFIDNRMIVVLHLSYSKVLRIDMKSQSITEDNQIIISNLNISAVHKPHAILGVVKMGVFSYLLCVEKCELVGKINSAEIYKILKTSLVPLFQEHISNIPEDINVELNNLKNLLTMGFYYSFNCDLSNSLQRQYHKNFNIKESHNIDAKATAKYFWNYSINKRLVDAKVDKIWSVVCIFGYIRIDDVKLNDETVQLGLISRKSVNHPGIFYKAKGIKEYGHCANYVETESLFIIKQKVYSFVILRGSPPIKFGDENFENNNLSEKKISTSFQNHLVEIQQDFSYIMMINLMNELNPEEERLSKKFKSQFEISEIKNCKYHEFDMYNICKNNDFENLDNFIKQRLLVILDNFKYHCDNGEKDHLTEQIGVIRLNCYDCLNRTNIFQSRVCWQILLNIVSDII